MLEESPQSWGGVPEHSQVLLIQAVRSLEAAYLAYQNILRAAKNPSTTRELLRSDISTVDIKFKQTFYSLSLLHILLYNQDCGVADGASIWKNFKVDSASVSEKISEVESLVSEIKIDVPPSYFPSEVKMEVKAEENAEAKADVKVSTEEIKATSVVATELEKASPEVEISVSQTIAPYMPAVNLAVRLRNFRSVLEERCKEHGFKVAIIQALHELEKLFHIPRDPRTSSLWNMDHQQQRKEKFEGANEKFVYRWKCECKYSDNTPVPATAEEEDHAHDAYCPRNIKKDEAELSKQCKLPPKTRGKRVNGPKGKKLKDPTKKAKADAIIQITMDHIGRQNIKDHFSLIKNMISTEYRKPKPWEGRYFGMVLSGPGNTGEIVYSE